jgi:hypothetical protein
MTNISINVYKDGLTGQMQLSIDDQDGGYRLHGPKFNGSSSKPVLSCPLDSMSKIAEIRRYLNEAEAQLKKGALP